MLSKRHGTTGHHGVSCFHHLRSSDPPLNLVESAEAFVDLIATRLSDTHAALDPRLAREVLGGIRAHWASAPLAYVDALCTVLANLGDTRPFLREQLAIERSPAAHAVLAETLAELDRSFADEPRRDKR